jgi:hypothetical protein
MELPPRPCSSVASASALRKERSDGADDEAMERKGRHFPGSSRAETEVCPERS